MDQEGHAPANKSRKIEEDRIAQDSIFLNVDDDKAVDKSVCSSVVDLTDDAWLLVFDCLDTVDRIRIARVCQRWKELIRMSWKTITRLSFKNITCAYLSIGDFLEIYLRKCGTRLRCLDISNILDYCLTLRALDLVGLYGTSLQEVSFRQIDLTKTALKTVAETLPRLRSLSLIKCKYIGKKEELQSALKMPQSLKSLNVAGNEWINDDIISQAPQSLIEVIAYKCRGHLTDRGVRILAERCPNLETIDIGWCTFRITGKSITALAKNCPKLKRLPFDANVPYGEVYRIAKLLPLSYMPLLEELNMNQRDALVTDQFFNELGRHCLLLRSISCRGCDKLTDAAICNLSPCLNLENIILSCGGWSCRITDDGLIQLSSAHSELKKVGWSWTSHIASE